MDSQPGETGRQYDEEENDYEVIPMEVDEGEDALGAVGGASAGQNI